MGYQAFTDASSNTQALIRALDVLGERHGWSIFDYEANKSWDLGQAICRDLYGISWFETPEWRHDNELPDVPLAAVEQAKQWLRDGLPEWAKEPDTPEEE